MPTYQQKGNTVHYTLKLTIPNGTVGIHSVDQHDKRTFLVQAATLQIAMDYCHETYRQKAAELHWTTDHNLGEMHSSPL